MIRYLNTFSGITVQRRGPFCRTLICFREGKLFRTQTVWVGLN